MSYENLNAIFLLTELYFSLNLIYFITSMYRFKIAAISNLFSDPKLTLKWLSKFKSFFEFIYFIDLYKTIGINIY